MRNSWQNSIDFRFPRPPENGSIFTRVDRRQSLEYDGRMNTRRRHRDVNIDPGLTHHEADLLERYVFKSVSKLYANFANVALVPKAKTRGKPTSIDLPFAAAMRDEFNLKMIEIAGRLKGLEAIAKGQDEFAEVGDPLGKYVDEALQSRGDARVELSEWARRKVKAGRKAKAGDILREGLQVFVSAVVADWLIHVVGSHANKSHPLYNALMKFELVEDSGANS